MPPLLTPCQGIDVKPEPSKKLNNLAVMNGEERYYSDVVFMACESWKALELFDSGLNPREDTQSMWTFGFQELPLQLFIPYLLLWTAPSIVQAPLWLWGYTWHFFLYLWEPVLFSVACKQRLFNFMVSARWPHVSFTYSTSIRQIAAVCLDPEIRQFLHWCTFIRSSFLFFSHSMVHVDLSSLTRNWTHALCNVINGVLSSGASGKSHFAQMNLKMQKQGRQDILKSDFGPSSSQMTDLSCAHLSSLICNLKGWPKWARKLPLS